MSDHRTTRRAALLGALGLLGAATVAQGQTRFDEDEGRGSIRRDGRRRERFRMQLPGGTRAAPRSLLIETDAGAAAARLPRVAEIREEDRLPIAGAAGPFGPLFAPQPAPSYVRARNLLGAAELRGETLVLRLRGAPVDLRSARRVQILTRPPRGRGLVSYSLTLDLVAADPAPSGGLDAGGVYWADDRLLVSPPHDALFGARLWG